MWNNNFLVPLAKKISVNIKLELNYQKKKFTSCSEQLAAHCSMPTLFQRLTPHMVKKIDENYTYTAANIDNLNED